MPRKIRSAAVIGSGIMGGGIAALLAGTGIKTLLLDIVPPDLKAEEKKRSGGPQSNREDRSGYGLDDSTGSVYVSERCRAHFNWQPDR
jgi:3-hydroxyacyl-CoA dehydrogenase